MPRGGGGGGCENDILHWVTIPVFGPSDEQGAECQALESLPLNIIVNAQHPCLCVCVSLFVVVVLLGNPTGHANYGPITRNPNYKYSSIVTVV